MAIAQMKPDTWRPAINRRLCPRRLRQRRRMTLIRIRKRRRRRPRDFYIRRGTCPRIAHPWWTRWVRSRAISALVRRRSAGRSVATPYWLEPKPVAMAAVRAEAARTKPIRMELIFWRRPLPTVDIIITVRRVWPATGAAVGPATPNRGQGARSATCSAGHETMNLYVVKCNNNNNRIARITTGPRRRLPSSIHHRLGAGYWRLPPPVRFQGRGAAHIIRKRRRRNRTATSGWANRPSPSGSRRTATTTVRCRWSELSLPWSRIRNCRLLRHLRHVIRSKNRICSKSSPTSPVYSCLYILAVRLLIHSGNFVSPSSSHLCTTTKMSIKTDDLYQQQLIAVPSICLSRRPSSDESWTVRLIYNLPGRAAIIRLSFQRVRRHICRKRRNRNDRNRHLGWPAQPRNPSVAPRPSVNFGGPKIKSSSSNKLHRQRAPERDWHRFIWRATDLSVRSIATCPARWAETPLPPTRQAIARPFIWRQETLWPALMDRALYRQRPGGSRLSLIITTTTTTTTLITANRITSENCRSLSPARTNTWNKPFASWNKFTAVSSWTAMKTCWTGRSAAIYRRPISNWSNNSTQLRAADQSPEAIHWVTESLQTWTRWWTGAFQDRLRI